MLDDAAIRCFATGYKTLRTDDAGCAIEPVLALKLATIGLGAYFLEKMFDVIEGIVDRRLGIVTV